jgi:hypothetical protein
VHVEHVRMGVPRYENVYVHLTGNARKRIQVTVGDDLVPVDDAYPDRTVCDGGREGKCKGLQKSGNLSLKRQKTDFIVIASDNMHVWRHSP